MLTGSGISFERRREVSSFRNARGEPAQQIVEIRVDPLTGETVRLLPDSGAPFRVPDHGQAALDTGGANCPFCPENLERLTPRFDESLVSGGRIRRGAATVFPNLFPYAGYNGVVLFSRQHYVRLHEFSAGLLVSGFEAAQEFVRAVLRASDEALWVAINWNYLPASGGSILHPHLHVTLSGRATNYQRLMEEAGTRIRQDTGRDGLDCLADAEQAAGERWLGVAGSMRWIHAFAPRGHNDFIGIFRAWKIADIAPAEWQDLACSLRAVFATLQEQGLASFNLVLTESATMPVHLRLVPRLAYGALDTSDINFCQMVHAEPLSARSPEAVAALARRYFSSLG